MPFARNRGVFRLAGVVALSVTLQGRTESRIGWSRITPSHNENGTQIVNRWENVAALVTGTRLRVRLADGSRLAGTLASVSIDQLVVQLGGQAGTVGWGRDRVQRVEERRGPRLGSGAGWGALAGVLAGAIVLRLVPPADSSTHGVYPNHEFPTLGFTTAIGVGTGLAINAARRQWVVVYISGALP